MLPDHEKPGSGSFRTLDIGDIEAFVHEVLFAPTRELPVVGISTSTMTRRPWVDPAELALLLEDHAIVVLMETGRTTFALADGLPEDLDVYGGAVRIWWPGLTPQSDLRDHPLLFARSGADGERVLRRVVQQIRPGDADELAPSPWRRVAEEYTVGDVVRGRVTEVRHFGALVELLPGAAGLVHLSELDWTFVQDPADFVHPGDRIAVEIMTLDPARGRAELSLKRAHGQPLRHAIAAEPGGEPFLAGELGPAGGVAAAEAARTSGTSESSDTDERIADLEAQVDTLQDERGRLRGRLREVKRELRSSHDRLEYVQRQTADETNRPPRRRPSCWRCA